VIASTVPGAVQPVVASTMASSGFPHPSTPDPAASAGKSIFVDYPEFRSISLEKFDLGTSCLPTKEGVIKTEKTNSK